MVEKGGCVKLLGYEVFYIATTMIAVVIWGFGLVHCGKNDNGKIKKPPLILCVIGIVLMFSSICLDEMGTFAPYHEEELESVKFASVIYNKSGNIISENHEQGLYFKISNSNEAAEYFVKKGNYEIVSVNDSERFNVKYKKYQEKESDKIFKAIFFVPEKTKDIISGESVLEISYGSYDTKEVQKPKNYETQEIKGE